MSSPTAFEHLVHALREAGVACVYGVEGDRSHPIADAIRRTDGIEWVHVPNEDAVPFAAQEQPPQASKTTGTDAHHELTAEQASYMAVTAVISDLEFWARTASVDGRVGLNDLTRTLDVIRLASTPEN
jgi:hypothetical protein